MCMEKKISEMKNSRCSGPCDGPSLAQAPGIELPKKRQKCHGAQEITAGKVSDESDSIE